MNKSQRHQVTAFCFRAGDVEIGKRCPDGALPIMSGPRKLVISLVQQSTVSRLFGKTLKPCVASVYMSFLEKEDPDTHVDKLLAFTRSLKRDCTDNNLQFHC